jgi:hypothetical protein
MGIVDNKRVLELKKAEDDARSEFEAAMNGPDIEAARRAAEKYTTASKSFGEYVMQGIEPYRDKS